MTWTLAGNLECRADHIRDEFPGITIYSVGDTDHAASASDHNPDARDVVHAIDPMTYADTARGHAIVEWALSDTTDLEYIIFDRVIWSRSNGFEPDDYHGSNPHEDHPHLSGKHGDTGYTSATGTGYDTDAENYRPAGFGQPEQIHGGSGMFFFTVEGDDNVWKSDGFRRSLFSGPDAGGVNTYRSYKPLETAGVPFGHYTAEDIDAMHKSVPDALDWIGGPAA